MSGIESGSGDMPPDGGFAYGYASAQGRRAAMEDGHILGVPICEDGSRQLWAVLDGHAGRRAVELALEWIPEALRDAMAAEGVLDSPDALLPESTLCEVMQTIDERLLAAAEAAGGWEDGTTALLVISGASTSCPLQLVQLGDCQAVCCSAFGADNLCPSHRTGEAEEEVRIAANDGQVVDGRVVGDSTAVAVTRSLGDLSIKRERPGCVISTPHVSEHALSPADELLILGCDGLWDVVEADDAYECAKRAGRGRQGMWDLPAASKALVELALNNKSGDNVSVVCIGLRRPKYQRKVRASARDSSYSADSGSARDSARDSAGDLAAAARSSAAAAVAAAPTAVQQTPAAPDRMRTAPKLAAEATVPRAAPDRMRTAPKLRPATSKGPPRARAAPTLSTSQRKLAAENLQVLVLPNGQIAGVTLVA